jgi:hypothetical protein
MAVASRFFSDAVLNEFEEQLQRSRSLTALRSMMERSLSKLGFGAYAYVRFAQEPSENPEIQGLSSYPRAWCERYKSANYFATDPTLWYCKYQIIPVAWHELDKINAWQGASSNMFEEARDHGLRHGITVPLHSGNQWVSAMNVVTDLPLREASSQIAACRDMIHVMAILFHGTAEARIRTANSFVPNAPPSNPAAKNLGTLRSKREYH